MAEKENVRPRVVLGIAGGSGSGKSQLARRIESAFPGRTTTVCHDWYYKHTGSQAKNGRVDKMNFDHPKSLETGLMCRQLDELLEGEPVDAPTYDYATSSRLAVTRRVAPKPLLILDGILILHEKALRDRMTVSVFIEVPDDIRLVRRVRRDCTERRVDLSETLCLYENSVRPMHRRFIEPSARHATWIWTQLEDKSFPDLLVRDLRKRLDDPVPAASR